MILAFEANDDIISQIPVFRTDFRALDCSTKTVKVKELFSAFFYFFTLQFHCEYNEENLYNLIGVGQLSLPTYFL